MYYQCTKYVLLHPLHIYVFYCTLNINISYTVYVTLGGNIARQEFNDVVAIHATCYEGYTKFLVLKASNGYHSSPYYNPQRFTITKPLMFITRKSLLDEIKALSYIALVTNRSLLLPNILIGVGTETLQESLVNQCLIQNNAYKRTCRYFSDAMKFNNMKDYNKAPLYDNEHYWYVV
jgi:hypothetical protein